MIKLLIASTVMLLAVADITSVANAQPRSDRENNRVAFAPGLPYGVAVVGGAAARHGNSINNWAASGGANRAWDGAARAGERMKQAWSEPQGVYQTTPAYRINGQNYDAQRRPYGHR